MTATLHGILVKRAHRGPLDRVEQATLITRRGLADNADIGGRRQVTLLSLRTWRELTAHLGDLDPALRRANLLVDDLDFVGRRGAELMVGAARLRINGETRPCRALDFTLPGLQAALDPRWGGGAYAEVVEGAAIAVGDAVGWC